jgi:hypothetical protein
MKKTAGKRTKEDGVMDEERVKEIAQNEKDAVVAFFFQGSGPSKKQKKSVKEKGKNVVDVANDVVAQAKALKGSSNDKGHDKSGGPDNMPLSLAVPLDVEVPKVQEMQRAGAGVSYNAFTDQFNPVKQGVNATKGRGVINNTRIYSKQVTTNDMEEVSAFLSKNDVEETTSLAHDDSSKVSGSHPSNEETKESIHNDDEDHDVNDVKDVNGAEDNETNQEKISQDFLQFRHQCEVENLEDVGKDPMVYTPNYVNDVWAANTVNAIHRRKQSADKSKDDRQSKLYIRRDKEPFAFEIPKPVIKEKPASKTSKTSLKTDNKTDASKKKASSIQSEYAMEAGEKNAELLHQWQVNTKIMAQIITFNADGSFQWPKSSPHKCWNCCENFTCPPAMVPRHYNWKHRYYEVYGNFCSWSCAKRFASETKHEFYVEPSPSLDYFAWKYFGAMLPIPMAPPRYLLSTFSSFGMSIEDYREVGRVRKRDGFIADNYVMVQPPVVPYELMVVWDERKPQRRAIKKGFDQNKKRKFEEQMSGAAPLPNMPKPMVKKTTIVKDTMRNNTTTKTVVSTNKKSEKNIFTILSAGTGGGDSTKK